MVNFRRISIFVLVEKDKFLLQRKTLDHPRIPGTWCFFGGGIDGDETPEQALIRECKEELNYDIVDYKFFKHYTLKGEDVVRESYFYIAPLSVSLGELELLEGMDMKMFTADEALKLQLWEPDRVIINDLRQLNFKQFFKH